MNVLRRHQNNPILQPNPNNEWERYAAFNGSIIKKDDQYILLYRAMSDEKVHEGVKLNVSIIGKAESVDGVNFSNRTRFITPSTPFDRFGCEDPRVIAIDNRYVIFYTALSNFPFNQQSIKVAVAISPDLQTISEKHIVTPFNAKAMTMFPEKIDGNYTVLVTVNTDNPPTYIGIAQFKNFETLWDQNFWLDWYRNRADHLVNLKRINSDQVEIGAQPIKTPHGWILLYSYIKNYFSQHKEFRIEAVLLDVANPKKIIGRIKEPCLVPEERCEHEGRVNSVVFPEGALLEDDMLHVYYGASDMYCCRASAHISEFLGRFDLHAPDAPKCTKFSNNPLLVPIEEHVWESKSVSNPAVVELEGKIYLLYRATGENNISSFGLAVSSDGLYIDERVETPVYPPQYNLDLEMQRLHSHGCEDPRITRIEDMLYMCYTAFDGQLPRLALTSITVPNFLSRAWGSWSLPKIISEPNLADKDGCLFPEKIDDMYVFLHRIEPNIVIDSVSDLFFIKKPYLGYGGFIRPGLKIWDEVKIGINTPPLKTNAGWLVFYHGISAVDRHYRVGALLFDLKDITKLIGRTPYPILEPEAYFEKEGIVPNVVFPCGFAIKGDDVYLYYGAADRVICGAKINLQLLVDYLVKSNVPNYLDQNSTSPLVI